MRSIEGSGLGATVPVLTQPGRLPIYRMLMKGQRYLPGCVPDMLRESFNPAVGVQTCDVDGDGIRCSLATPVAAATTGLGGLGALGAVTWSNVACGSYDRALSNLQILLAEADRVGVTGIEYDQAKALIDDETSWAQWKHATPLLPETCTKETLKAEGLYAALNMAVRAAGGTRGVDLPLPSENQPPSDSTANTIKTVAIVAGISVAVLGTIYLVGPFVRAAAKAGARRLK